MAVWCESTLSEINKIKRNDAEYYQPYYRKLEKILNFSKTEQLSSLSFITDGIHGSPEIEEDGIRYISAKCVKDNYFITDNCIFISHKQNNSNPRTQLKDGDVIITTVGTIGNVAVVDEDVIPSNCDRHVGIIRIQNTDKLSPYYISTFLNSKYGRFQSMRESAGNVQLNLYIKNIGNIYIPRFFNDEEKIAPLTKKAYEQRKLSQSLYTQAQQLLEQELGLDKLKFEKPVGYETSFSEVVNNNRADAEFYNVQFDPIINAAINYKNGWLPLNQISNRILPNFDAQKYRKNFDYIEIGDVNISDGSYSMNGILSNKLPANAKIKLNGGEIVISQVRPTRGAIAIINNNLKNDTICSGAFYVCTATKITQREIIWLYLRCIKKVFEKYCGGTSYPTIDSHYISNCPIPLFNNNISNRIRKLIIESKQAKRESNQLLEQAKTRVEQLIEEAAEKNEKTGRITDRVAGGSAG